MKGWLVPPPRKPTKSKTQLETERVEKVRWLVREGYVRSERIRNALLKVPRENFIPADYRDYAYVEVPLPLPGERATISCPHGYPLFYEPLGLDEGHRFLEVGSGSGYGAALAREIVGSRGFVVSLEIDPVTFQFARANLDRAGYLDITLVLGDGGFGYREKSPYDRISVTAASSGIPPPLIEQLGTGGRLVAPVFRDDVQELVVLEKGEDGVETRVVTEVLFVSLRGGYGL